MYAMSVWICTIAQKEPEHVTPQIGVERRYVHHVHHVETVDSVFPHRVSAIICTGLLAFLEKFLDHAYVGHQRSVSSSTTIQAEGICEGRKSWSLCHLAKWQRETALLSIKHWAG